MKVIANVAPLSPSYKSSSELKFAQLAGPLLEAHFESRVMWLAYEPMRFRVPGGHYTPDFGAVLEDGRMVFVEVKGSRKQKGYRDARSKLRAAAEWYAMFTWIEVVEEDGFAVEVMG